MNVSPVKYIFDLDMGHEPKNSVPKKATEQEILIKQARNEGYQAGLRDGKRDETARILQAQLNAINNISSQCINILGDRDKVEKQAFYQAITLGTNVGRKLASHLVSSYPDAEINALIKECLISLQDVPHLVIRCHPDIADACQENTEQNMKTSGFSGRLVVMGDPEIELGDGRIEWVKGGLVRETKNIDKQIDNSIKNFLSAHNISTKEENEETAEVEQNILADEDMPANDKPVEG